MKLQPLGYWFELCMTVWFAVPLACCLDNVNMFWILSILYEWQVKNRANKSAYVEEVNFIEQTADHSQRRELGWKHMTIISYCVVVTAAWKSGHLQPHGLMECYHLLTNRNIKNEHGNTHKKIFILIWEPHGSGPGKLKKKWQHHLLSPLNSPLPKKPLQCIFSDLQPILDNEKVFSGLIHILYRSPCILNVLVSLSFIRHLPNINLSYCNNGHSTEA